MPLTETDHQGLRRGAFAEGAIWADSPYYDQAEPYIADQWRGYIWPMIGDCDFTCVVDLAAGHGRNSHLLREVAGQIIVVDINQENVDFCRRRFAGDSRFRFLKNDGCSLAGIADQSVSLVYTFDAMVHFDSDVIRNYLREFRRVLRPGGRGFCHHSNYTGNPSGDFRDDPSWRNFMSQQLFHHYCAKEGLEVVRSRVIDWGTPQHDCLTVFEKPASGPARKECVPVRIWYAGEHQGQEPGLFTRRHLAAEMLSPTAEQTDDPTRRDWCDAYGDHLLVQPPPPHTATPTIVSLDLASWASSRVRLTGASCEVAILGEQPSPPIVCHLQLRDGERGQGAILGCTEQTITTTDGWVRLHVSVPPGATMRSLLLGSRMADGAANHFHARATFRDIQLSAE